MTIPADRERELDEKAAHDAVWIGLWAAQRCGWQDVVNQLTSIIATIAGRRGVRDDEQL